MRLLLSLLISFFVVSGTSAEETAEIENNILPTEEQTISEDKQISEQARDDVVFIRKVEKKIVQLPTCYDEKLLTHTRQYISEYFVKNEGGNSYQRRRRHFILNNLDKFATENVANYKTESTRPVSDIIADLRVNHNILEENMRLCKNISLNKEAAKVYLLIYPVENGYNVIVINLKEKQQKDEQASFYYE